MGPSSLKIYFFSRLSFSCSPLVLRSVLVYYVVSTPVSVFCTIILSVTDLGFVITNSTPFTIGSKTVGAIDNTNRLDTLLG